MALSYSTTLRNNMLDEITSIVGASGRLKIYSGSAPSSVNDAATGTLLADLPLSATFAGAAGSGQLEANSITSDTDADATGTAGYFRLTTSGGTAHVQGSVGTSGADLNLNSTAIQAGATVSVTSLTITGGNP